MPWIICGALAWKRSGMKNAVASDAVATPKLIAICCIVLAMVLALLVCSSVTSAYTRVFMLVYCSDVRNPKQNVWITISQIGVLAPMVANTMINTPMVKVFEIRTP